MKVQAECPGCGCQNDIDEEIDEGFFFVCEDCNLPLVCVAVETTYYWEVSSEGSDDEATAGNDVVGGTQEENRSGLQTSEPCDRESLGPVVATSGSDAGDR